MCGIAAIFAYSSDAPGVDRDELVAIRDRMTDRGPDGAGLWLSPDHRVGLAHRRLSIIDLSESGAQPMHSADGRYVVTFNGEIYNYQALRIQLQARGRVFRSSSDTEVLLHLYAEQGREMVHDLRGMYAFAIWDNVKRTLFLARDPFGIKPLYYADDGRTIRVASQVKALLCSKHIDTAPEPAGHVGFFLWGSVPDPFTLYRGIKALPAGHTLTVSPGPALHSFSEGGSVVSKPFCSIPRLLSEAESVPHSHDSRDSRALTSAIADSIQHHLIADVPVGIFLSAGIDSTTIASYVSARHSDVRTVTLGFTEFQGRAEDEVPLAEKMAHACGANHQTIWVKRSDFEQHTHRLLDAMDQPSIDGVNTYFVSMAARQAGLKVALSGLGGDELFGGYPSFREIPPAVHALEPFQAVPGFGRAFRVVTAGALRRFTSPKYAGLFEYGPTYGGAYLLRRGLFMPWELPNVLNPDLVREGWQRLNTIDALNATAALNSAVGADTSPLTPHSSPRASIAALELCWYMRHQLLRDSDWAGMAHSLEIRVPLVDIDLFRRLAPVLTERRPPGKLDLASSAPRPLPAEITQRSKTGFTVPVRDWLLQSALGSPLSARTSSSSDRGLRGWAHEVHSGFANGLDLHRATMRRRRKSMVHSPWSTVPSPDSHHSHDSRAKNSHIRILALVTDAFGGHGGIAKFNRDLLTALCAHEHIDDVIALPRMMPHELGPLPEKLTHVTEGLGGKASYAKAVIKTALRLRRESVVHGSLSMAPPMIWCGHLNLLPLAWLASRRAGAKLVLNLHGIEAWKPHRSWLVRRLLSRVDYFISVSEFTKGRIRSWADLDPSKFFILPNCVDLSAFGPGPKNPVLVDRYGLKGKTTLMTLARLSSAERYKGIDEVLEVLPDLARDIPTLAYLICGDGDDRPRLMEKAASLGLKVVHSPWSMVPSSHSHDSRDSRATVVFTGRISEEQKADHYRLSDAFVMPGWGEGFGIVYLEALACGVPAIGSKADGSRDALLEGKLGPLVNPRDPEEIKQAIRALLNRTDLSSVAALRKEDVPASNGHTVHHFSSERFQARLHEIIEAIESFPTRQSMVHSPWSCSLPFA